MLSLICLCGEKSERKFKLPFFVSVFRCGVGAYIIITPLFCPKLSHTVHFYTFYVQSTVKANKTQYGQFFKVITTYKQTRTHRPH